MIQVNKKDIVPSIIFSIITCGIYSLYWLYCLARDVNEVTDHREDMSAGMVLLLTIVTCGLFQLYWMYKTGTKLDEASARMGRPSQNRGLLLILLSFFGLIIVAYAIIQSEVNDIIDSRYNNTVNMF